MERTWLETIQLLGLDVEVGLVLGMLGLEALARLAGRLRSFARRPLRSATRSTRGAMDPLAGDAAEPWPVGELRPSH